MQLGHRRFSDTGCSSDVATTEGPFSMVLTSWDCQYKPEFIWKFTLANCDCTVTMILFTTKHFNIFTISIMQGAYGLNISSDLPAELSPRAASFSFWSELEKRLRTGPGWQDGAASQKQPCDSSRAYFLFMWGMHIQRCHTWVTSLKFLPASCSHLNFPPIG